MTASRKSLLSNLNHANSHIVPGGRFLCWLLVVASAVDLILLALRPCAVAWVGYVGTQRDLAFPASKGWPWVWLPRELVL